MQMIQLFLRARAHNYLKSRRDDPDFKARSVDRDAETDRSRVNSILAAIKDALQAAEQEQSGLNRRVEDVLARAAVTLGNGTDEYLERDALDSHHQDLFSAEISNGQRRLKELAAEITHFKFLKAAVLSRFPDFKPPAPSE
jgi:cobalamin-dependent methionine synthase I